jgi:large subunit ribosomal protein L19
MSKIQSQFLPESVRNRKDFDIRAGDTVRVDVKIQEKGKTRIQSFEGLVLSRKHGRENGGTITVRKVSNGVGVERIFPIYSPAIDAITVTRRAKVRQSKLYFLRDVVSKVMRYKLRRISDVKLSTKDLPEWENEAVDQDVADEATAEVEETTSEAEETTEETPVEETSADSEEETPEAPAKDADEEAETKDKEETESETKEASKEAEEKTEG